MLKQKRAISSYLLLIGILSLLVVGSWVAYNLYSAVIKSQITEEQQADILPLIDKLNSGALNNLRQRTVFSETELKKANSINYDPDAKESKNLKQSVLQPSSIATQEMLIKDIIVGDNK